MGETSKRLHGKLKKKAASLNLPTGKMRGRADMPSTDCASTALTPSPRVWSRRMTWCA